jgi:hypothetical protein
MVTPIRARLRSTAASTSSRIRGPRGSELPPPVAGQPLHRRLVSVAHPLAQLRPGCDRCRGSIALSANRRRRVRQEWLRTACPAARARDQCAGNPATDSGAGLPGTTDRRRGLPRALAPNSVRAVAGTSSISGQAAASRFPSDPAGSVPVAAAPGNPEVPEVPGTYASVARPGCSVECPRLIQTGTWPSGSPLCPAHRVLRTRLYLLRRSGPAWLRLDLREWHLVGPRHDRSPGR